ncbi:hypothetical protein P3T73_01955 [Kiritimatiellota bacterium B12222]|nr:hypothetical protein P3T73_01955 [Kiritimatiellota bacterium B12222]
MIKFEFCEKSRETLGQWISQLSLSPPENNRPYLIGIGGPGGSGKSHFTHWLRQEIPHSVVLSLDDFRLPRSERPKHAPFGSHPEAIDLPRLFATLTRAREGRSFSQPHFDVEHGKVLKESPLSPAPVIFVDGEITAYSELHPYLDYLFLVQTSYWTQLRTRLHRDTRERKCSLRKTLRIYVRSNLIDHPRFAKKAKARADLILYRNRHHRFYLRKSQL